MSAPDPNDDLDDLARKTSDDLDEAINYLAELAAVSGNNAMAERCRIIGGMLGLLHNARMNANEVLFIVRREKADNGAVTQ